MEGNNGSNSIKSVQMGFITFITQTGVGIITLSSDLADEAGHDGWISLLIMCLLTLLASALMIVLMKRYHDKAIYDINKYIFGKIIGTLFNSLMVVYLLISTIGGAALFNYFIRITLLQETPSWVLAPFISLPSFYLVWQGLKNMGRFLYLSVYSYFPILILIFVLLREFRLSFLMPIGEAGIPQILYGLKSSFFAFLGFELIAFFYPYVTDREKVLKWQMFAILASLVFFLAVFVASTGIFGSNFLKNQTLPFFNISRILNTPILERVDLYFTAIWFIPTACSLRSYIFAAFDGINKVFGLKKTKIVYVIFFAAILIFSSIPRNFNQVLIVIEIINFTGIGVTLFILLCLLFSFVRRKGVYSR